MKKSESTQGPYSNVVSSFATLRSRLWSDDHKNPIRAFSSVLLIAFDVWLFLKVGGRRF